MLCFGAFNIPLTGLPFTNLRIKQFDSLLNVSLIDMGFIPLVSKNERRFILGYSCD